uniref:Uncharacterized protein n=1 Tax=Trypanosoma vivax (strain Y486) TaxID=1055687 RepID=G0U8R6_TRYVY|nr:hypothetical protein TVY486_1114790 [Trypanosoma vivax Y486]
MPMLSFVYVAVSSFLFFFLLSPAALFWRLHTVSGETDGYLRLLQTLQNAEACRKMALPLCFFFLFLQLRLADVEVMRVKEEELPHSVSFSFNCVCVCARMYVCVCVCVCANTYVNVCM